MFERNNITPEILTDVAVELLAAFHGEKVFAFYGKMGAGKTTLIREICSVLGCEDVVTSPTFTIINEYRNNQGDQVFHFDFYRLRELSEVFDLGYEEYFFSGAYCLIEWPEKVEALLPLPRIEVIIEENGVTSRNVRARAIRE